MKHWYEIKTLNEVSTINVLNIMAKINIVAYSYSYANHQGILYKYFVFRCKKDDLISMIKCLEEENIEIERIGRR